MRVKPVDPNAKIRDPHTMRPLPAEGGDVPDDNFWNRRLIEGDVVRIEAPLAEESAPPVGNEPLAPLTTRKGK